MIFLPGLLANDEMTQGSNPAVDFPHILPTAWLTLRWEKCMASVLVEHFFLGCRAHASYLVGSEGVAAVIDPQRDVDIYIDAAGQKGLKIEHIIETHLHADFVSGHYELAERTGARIYL